MPKLIPYQTAKATFSLHQKIGQLFMPAAFVNDTKEEIQDLEKLIQEQHIGSLCFFHSRASAATNFEGKKKVVHNKDSYQRLLYLIDRYQKAATTPLLIAIDAEWGLAMRIENTPQYPYAITLGAMQNQADLVAQVGQAIAADCAAAGIHWNLSPVVDINQNPENPVIGYRSFGEDRDQVTAYAQAYVQGMRQQGVLNAIKHFPGHGDTATDSHLGLPIIEKSKIALVQNELYPFIQLMPTHADAVMVGHLAIPALADGTKVSASVSKAIITDYLRGELGWQGIVISDALNMHAISKNFPEEGSVELAAFTAGNDVLCFADHVAAGIQQIIKQGNTAQIEASFARVWQLKQQVFNTPQPHKPNTNYKELMASLAQESLSLIHGSAADIATFRTKGYQLIQLGKAANHFNTALQATTQSPQTLLSLVPRQVKPKDNFGFSEGELQEARQLLLNGQTVLYLFGNPFVLNLLPWKKALAVVVVYQDFESFQQNAVAHFKGISKAKGQLPVSLKS